MESNWEPISVDQHVLLDPNRVDGANNFDNYYEGIVKSIDNTTATVKFVRQAGRSITSFIAHHEIADLIPEIKQYQNYHAGKKFNINQKNSNFGNRGTVIAIFANGIFRTDLISSLYLDTRNNKDISPEIDGFFCVKSNREFWLKNSTEKFRAKYIFENGNVEYKAYSQTDWTNIKDIVIKNRPNLKPMIKNDPVTESQTMNSGSPRYARDDDPSGTTA